MGKGPDGGGVLDELRITGEHLALFNEIAKALTSSLDERQVLQLIKEQISRLLRPSHWTLLLHDEATGELHVDVAVCPRPQGVVGHRIPVTHGPAGAAFETAEVQFTSERIDPAQVVSLTGQPPHPPRNVTALPLRARGKVIGVIELVDALNETAPRDELQALKFIADYAAIAVENARSFRVIRELTITDEHTGLYNARHLREVLDGELRRCARFKRTLSLLFVDLDRFKEVNDRHGHLIGTALLREVGDTLRSNIRKVDSAYRYGGDEFAVLLIETGIKEARVVGERLQQVFDSASFLRARGLSIRMTASIGLANFPQDSKDTAGLIDAADRAMYAAKARGRNMVVSTEDLPAPDVPS